MTVAIDMPVLPDLPRQLDRLITQVPAGQVTTYGRLAEALGDVVAARWVGYHLLHHAHDENCSCHRVVRSDGQLGHYITGDARDKAKRLAAEGIRIQNDRVDLRITICNGLTIDCPLVQLRRWQCQLAERVSLRCSNTTPRTVAGVDVSYGPHDRAVAAYVLFDLVTLEQLWSLTTTLEAPFPYISSYLVFRELAVYVELIEQVRAADRLADVLLVDGSGILHPRRAGSASCLGVVTGVPTIGLTKKLLCGELERRDLAPGDCCTITVSGKTVGTAMRSSSRSRRPIFVSPGHCIDVQQAAQLVQQTLTGRRLPEPIYWADRLSRETASG